jgi:hypothetical protein
VRGGTLNCVNRALAGEGEGEGEGELSPRVCCSLPASLILSRCVRPLCCLESRLLRVLLKVLSVQFIILQLESLRSSTLLAVESPLFVGPVVVE